MDSASRTLPRIFFAIALLLGACVIVPSTFYNPGSVANKLETLQANNAGRAAVHKTLGVPTHVFASHNADVWIKTGNNTFIAFVPGGGAATYPMENSQFTVVRYDEQWRTDSSYQAIGKRVGPNLLSMMNLPNKNDTIVNVFVRLVRDDGGRLECPEHTSIAFADFKTLGLPVSNSSLGVQSPSYRCIPDPTNGGIWLLASLSAGSVQLYFGHPKISPGGDTIKFTHAYEMLPSANTRTLYGGTFVIEAASEMKTLWDGAWLKSVRAVRNESRLARNFAASELRNASFQTMLAKPLGRPINLAWYGN